MLKVSVAALVLLAASGGVARRSQPASPLWDSGTFSILGLSNAPRAQAREDTRVEIVARAQVRSSQICAR
jgi:hypothetical protein